MKPLLLLLLILSGCSSQNDKDRISELEKQVQSDELIKYRAQYLQEAEFKFDRISRVPPSQKAVEAEIKYRRELCQDGKTRQIGNDNFDPDTVFGCADGIAFTLDKGAYVTSYIDWKLSIIAPPQKKD